MKLAVNIATYLIITNKLWLSPILVISKGVEREAYCYRRRHGDDVALLDKKLSGAVTELSHLVFRNGAAGAQLRDRPTDGISGQTAL